MIVKIAACLYILQAALCLASLSLNPFGVSASMESFATLLVGGLFAAMGVGLFKRTPWARWLALGNSLLGWTLGTLVFIAAIVGMVILRELVGGMFGGGLGSFFGFILLLFAVIFIVSIVINFKLYFYLRSEAGAQEFGVEVESFGAVMGSVGAWFAIAIVQGMMTSSGLSSNFSSRSDHQDYEQAAAQMRDEARRANLQRQRMEAETTRLESERLEQERIEAERQAQMEAVVASSPEESPMAEEARVPDLQAVTVNANEAEPAETTRNQILKCRDSSGAVQYTQGYCPPGTTRLEMSSN